MSPPMPGGFRRANASCLTRFPSCPTGSISVRHEATTPRLSQCRILLHSISGRMLDAHPKSAIFSLASRALQEGRIAIVTDVGRGMRWTLWRRKTSDVRGGRRSRVVLTPRRWRQVFAELSARAKVAKEPGHRGEHEVTVKTIAQGRPGCCGEPVVTMLVCLSKLCMRGCGFS